MTTFDELGVSQWLIDNLKNMRIDSPTPIQALTIPHVIKKKNVIGSANTGSGKTAAFALPILQELSRDPYGVFALILTPTRELAFQINEQFSVFAGAFNLRSTVITGGMDMINQSMELTKMPHIVLATPGRLADLIDRYREDLKEMFENVKYLVLDEADRMMEECFYPNLKTIIDFIPQKRQTLLYTATLMSEIPNKELIFGDSKEEPILIDLTEESSKTVESLYQEYLFIPETVKECYLVYLLRNILQESDSCIIFVSTCKKCHTIYTLLKELELPASFIHSMVSQRKRLKNIQRFKSQYSKILVATDVASRGLDIPSVELVINFDVPKNPRDYIHRVGRTARAGRGGQSLTLVTQYDIDLFLTIEKFIKQKLNEREVNEEEVLENLNEVAKTMQTVRIKMTESGILDKFDEIRKKNRPKNEETKESIKENPNSKTTKRKKLN